MRLVDVLSDKFWCNTLHLHEDVEMIDSIIICNNTPSLSSYVLIPCIHTSVSSVLYMLDNLMVTVLHTSPSPFPIVYPHRLYCVVYGMACRVTPITAWSQFGSSWPPTSAGNGVCHKYKISPSLFRNQFAILINCHATICFMLVHL